MDEDIPIAELDRQARTAAVEALQIQLGSIPDAIELTKDTLPPGRFRDAVVFYIKNEKKLREEEMKS